MRCLLCEKKPNEYWFSNWCKDCIVGMPKLKELQSEYNDVDYVFLSLDKSFTKVVFPAPFGPRRAKISPLRISKLTFFRASKLPL